MTLFKTVDEAATAVDEMFANAYQTAGRTSSFFLSASTKISLTSISTIVTAGEGDGDDSGEDSGDEAERPGDEEDAEEEEDNANTNPNELEDRGPSPEPEIVVTSSQENLGPSEEEDSEFAKELAKMVVDTSTESRKVDRRTAQALWESAVLPQNLKKKKVGGVGGGVEDGIGAGVGAEGDGEETEVIQGSEGAGVMNFTVITKRGNKQQTRQLAIPSESALAVQTRTAQMQDKVEQQHLKRLVLNYEQREEAEELKGQLLRQLLKQKLIGISFMIAALEMKSRPVKIRLAG